ncbi:sugar-phosphatase [Micrococcales bacterium KH10]|nr:sugar-phosphatase [Micrococcales bacterium KH10]
MTQTQLDVAAVLFDMDGTLVDSTPVVERLWAQFAAEYHIDLVELLGYSHGRQTRDTVSRFLPPGHDVDEVTAAFQTDEPNHTEGIAAIAGAVELINALPEDRLAVVTSAPRRLAEVRLLAAGIGIPKVLVTSEDVTRGKPDPMGYEIAAQRLGVVPQRCLVVEDAEAGLQAGIASGALTMVIGEHESAVTTALPRVKDFTDVTVQIFDDFLRITLP